MADQSAGTFVALRFEPGNPLLPTLPAPGDPTIGILNVIGVGGQSAVGPFEAVLDDHSAGPSPRILGFGGWYLDTTWMTPNPIDFGNITQDKQRTVTLHNTRRNGVDFTAFDDASLAGFSKLSPGLPVTLEPYSSQEMVVQADAVGPDSFDQEIDTTVDGIISKLRVIGRRVVSFELIPERPIVEVLQFKTDVMISKDGTEQAHSLAVAPRSTVTINVRHLLDVERTTLYNKLFGAQHLLSSVQAWWQSAKITNTLQATDTVIQCDTTAMEIAVESDVSIVLENRSVTQGEVLSFTASSITLAAQVGIVVPALSSVMPLRAGHNPGPADLATYPINVEDMQFKFTLFDYVNTGAVDSAYFETHPVDSLPIIKSPPPFSGETRKGSIVGDIEVIDSVTGVMSLTRSEPLDRPTQEVLAHIDSKADQKAWRDWLHFIRGSWGRFYIATGANDLPISSDFVLGGNSFTTVNMGTDTLIGNQAPRRDLAIEIAGVFYYRRITSVVDGGALETFTLDSIIPGSGNVAPADVRISWLMLSRLVGDVATFRHLYSDVGELRFEIRGVIE